MSLSSPPHPAYLAHSLTHTLTHTLPEALTDRVQAAPGRLRAALDDRSVENPAIPVIVVVVVAVAAFLALAAVIGAIAAFIFYCQQNGGRWPGLGVPGPKGGYYTLRCIK